MRTRGILGVVMTMPLILGACSSTGTTSSGQPAATDAVPDQSAVDSIDGGAGSEGTPTNGAASPADAGSAGGEGTVRAVFTIGEERYEIVGTRSSTNGCNVDGDGVFGGSVTSADDLTFVTFHLPPDGYVASDLYWDQALPYVEINVPGGPYWRANGNLSSAPPSGGYAELQEGLSKVDTFTFDASSASGTATFVDWNSVTGGDAFTPASGDPVTGTFELTCG